MQGRTGMQLLDERWLTGLVRGETVDNKCVCFPLFNVAKQWRLSRAATLCDPQNPSKTMFSGLCISIFGFATWYANNPCRQKLLSIHEFGICLLHPNWDKVEPWNSFLILQLSAGFVINWEFRKLKNPVIFVVLCYMFLAMYFHQQIQGHQWIAVFYTTYASSFFVLRAGDVGSFEHSLCVFVLCYSFFSALFFDQQTQTRM